jgi:hypothetical protein
MKLKQTIAVMAGLALAISAGAQGALDFANGANSLVIDNDTGEAVGQGIVQAGLYYTTDLGATPDPSIADDGWILIPDSITPVTTSPLSFLQGRFSKSPVTVTDAVGPDILVQARIWSVGYDTYALAMGSTDAKVSASDFGTLTLATGTNPRQTTADIFVNPMELALVPEPSTIVLGILGGLGTLFLLRRRS